MSTPAFTPQPQPASLEQLLREDIAKADEVLAAVEKARRDIIAAARIITGAEARRRDDDKIAPALADLSASARFDLSALFVLGRQEDEKREAIVAASAALATRGQLDAVLQALAPAAPEAGPEPGRRPRGHRAPRNRAERPLWPRAAGGAAPAAIPLAAFSAARTAVRHATAAKAVTATAAGAAVIAGAVTLGSGSQTLDYRTRAALPGAAYHVQDARPLASPSPVPSATTLTRQHHRYRPRHARPPVIPSPDPSPSTTPASSPSPSPSRGVLVVQQQSLAIGPARTALLVIEAEGGPVVWSAASSSDDVTLDASSGGIQAGGSAVITVTVSPAAAVLGGSAVVTVNGQAVQVTWGG